MILSNGATVSSTHLSLGGSNGTNILSASITGGSIFTTGFIAASGNYASAGITVDGGGFVLTADETTTFGTPASNFAVSFEGGGIVWTAVADLTEFSTFQTTFNTWVDDGLITSSAFTNAELKADFSFINGTGAVLGVPEPSTYALLSGFCALGVIMLRRRR